MAPRDHPNPRGAEQPVPSDVDPPVEQQALARCRQRREVRHLTSGHHGERAFAGKTKHVLHPLSRHFLDHGGSRAALVDRAVLLPGGNEPVGGDRRGCRPAEHPAEEPGAAGSDEPPFTVREQVLEHLNGLDPDVGERHVEARPQVPVLGSRRDVLVVECFVEVDRELRRTSEYGGIGHGVDPIGPRVEARKLVDCSRGRLPKSIHGIGVGPTLDVRTTAGRLPRAHESASFSRMSTDNKTDRPRDFIRDVVARHVEEGRYPAILTRFPPEPNGFPTIGHAKAICVSFGIAEEFGGLCNLRFDDTNPHTEDMEYVEAFIRDIHWLGFDWEDRLFFASDYFEQLYDFAVILIEKGKAYVDSMSEQEIRDYRGTVTEPGKPSRYRDRPVAESLDLFRRMRQGEFEDGAHVLRAKIDMAHPNMIMRDPVLWRIRHATHYRRGDEWCIYPLYDYTHCLSDAIEGISHSICTLEFENNREIYDWLLEEVGFEEPRPHQYEFARLNVEYTIVSKRKLLQLVDEGHVAGWDDPRMPTLSGLRRRGVTPDAIRAFCDMTGVTKTNAMIDIAKFEYAIRDDLNRRAPRVMAVSDPLKVVITNWPVASAHEGDLEEGVEWLDAPSYPHDVPREGSRPVPFGRELWIERSDFSEDPPKGFRRLTPGGEVRLRYAYFIRCDEVVKDESGEVVELRCTYDPETRSGQAADGRKVKGTIHWVEASKAVPCELRLYDRLFSVPDPRVEPEGGDFKDHLNPESLQVREGWIEPSVADDPAGSRYQFERLGYFVSDAEDSTPERLVYNRTVTLRDTWARKGASPRAAEATGTSAGPGAGAGKPTQTDARTESTFIPPAERDRTEAEQSRFAALAELGVGAADSDVLARDPDLYELFEDVRAAGAPSGPSGKWIVHDVRPLLREFGVSPGVLADALVTIVTAVDRGEATTRVGRDVLATVVREGGDATELLRERKADRIDDAEALGPIIDRLIAEHPEQATELREGRDRLMGFFVGQVMRETGGKAAPQVVQSLVRERLIES